MSALLAQQQMLLEALFVWPAHDAMKKIASSTYDVGARGLKAYQSNGHALAQRALQSAYPVIHQLVGDDSFSDLARAIWHAHPPQSGDVGLWGEALADFIAASEQLADEPYLSEVACAEWALHRAARAADAHADMASLTLLTTQDPAELTLVLAPGTWTLACVWPVASIIHAHGTGNPSFDAVGQQLRDHVAQNLVVWREGLEPRLREALPGECDAVQSLLAGQPLSAALDAAPLLDFPAWLPMALQSSLVLGATLLPS